MEVDSTRRDACFSKFADCKKNVGLCVVCKVEEGADSRAEGIGRCCFCLTRAISAAGYRSVILAENVVRRKGVSHSGNSEFGS